MEIVTQTMNACSGNCVFRLGSGSPLAPEGPYGAVPKKVLAPHTDLKMTEPRPYQCEAYLRVIERNTIVHMPTGCGKTLIACMAAEWFIGKVHKCVLVLAPKRCLITQHADVFRNECLGLEVAEVASGLPGCPSTRKDWDKLTATYDILVATPEICRKAIQDHQFLAMDTFCLVVFDETHYVRGNHSMKHLADLIRTCPEEERPRVLALTASFANTSARESLKQVKDSLESLLDADIFCPDIPDEFLNARESRTVFYTDDDVHESSNDAIKAKVSELIHDFNEAFPNIRSKDLHKARGRASHVFSNLGGEGLLLYVQHGVCAQLEQWAMKMLQINPEEIPGHLVENGEKILKNVANIRKFFEDQARIFKSFTDTFERDQTNKARTLFDLLHQLSQENYTLGIIFVEQIATTYSLASIINTYCSDDNIVAEVFSGVVTGNVQKDTLKRFRDREINILVSTEALEEGLDVQACDFVIRFDYCRTTKSYIQGAGRARRQGARVFLFENNVQEEEAKELELQQAAREPKSLNAKPRYISSVSIEEFHPFSVHENSAKITVFNCYQLLLEYCQIVMRNSVDPEEHLIQRQSPPASSPSSLGHDSSVGQIVAMKYFTPEVFIIVPTALFLTRAHVFLFSAHK